MAVDEAIMQAVSMRLAPPTLRFYGWDPAALSLGYFQSAAKEIDVDACKAQGIDVVRRMTGGRAILHDRELTYSVIISEEYPGMPESVSESYKMLSMGLLEGMRCLDIDAQLASDKTLKPRDLSSGACFDAPSSYELVVDGKKVVGSAQVRQKGTILQHGSIINEVDGDMLFRCFAYPNEEIRERAKQIFLKKAVSLKDITGKPFQRDELCFAFLKGFEKGLGITLEEGGFLPEENKLAGELIEKYQSDEWNFRK